MGALKHGSYMRPISICFYLFTCYLLCFKQFVAVLNCFLELPNCHLHSTALSLGDGNHTLFHNPHVNPFQPAMKTNKENLDHYPVEDHSTGLDHYSARMDQKSIWDLKLTTLYPVMTITLEDHYTDLHPFAYSKEEMA